MSDKIPCPFVYTNGKACTGHVDRVEAYKADLQWCPDKDCGWKMGHGEPRSHYHLFCSEKGNHAGYKKDDDPRMKYYFSDLPAALRAAISAK